LVGSFESRVFAAGPQLGYIFPLNGMQGLLGAKSILSLEPKTDRRVGIRGLRSRSEKPLPLQVPRDDAYT
jgi:hypothetical protein